jgi:hypothetical protein
MTTREQAARLAAELRQMPKRYHLGPALGGLARDLRGAANLADDLLDELRRQDEARAAKAA